MPKPFSIPVPDNLDEELAVEDQRQQRRRHRANNTVTGSGDSSERATSIPKSGTSSFAAGSFDGRPATNDSSSGPAALGNESLVSRPDDRGPEVALIPLPQPTEPQESAFGPGNAGGSGSPSPIRNGSERRIRMRDVRAYCNFLYQRKESFNVRVRDGSRGIDVVDSAIKAFLAADERLRGKMSEDPRDYKLYSADDQTGEDEFAVSLDAPASNFSSVALKPLAGAYLSRFPQQAQMLPPPADDLSFTVNIVGAQNTRTVLLPADLTGDMVQAVLVEKLNLLEVVENSLMVKFGPTEVPMDQPYGFGAGGEKSGPMLVKCRTMMSLHRFGVTEFVIRGKLSDDAPPTPLTNNGSSSSGAFRKVDEEEAKTYRQFDVVKTNKFGAKQDRVLGVDADRIYNMKPGGAIGKTKNPERSIADIQNIRTFPDRPTYFEIEYTKDDTDRIDAKNVMECSLLVEKLKVLRKIQIHTREQNKSKTGFASFLSSKLGFGK